MENAIVVKNLTKHYQDFTLDHVNLKLPLGSIMGFIGENGAGKSTTIHLILDLIKKNEGEILVFDQDHIQNQHLWKENIGVVLDESTFPETLKLNDIKLIMKNTFKLWQMDVFESYVKKFDLAPNKKIKDYSRGMKMKLSIAIALSHQTKLLILDEATSGLDPLVRDEILDIFLDFVQNENHSILLSSHILSDLEKICDYITFIHKGKIILSESKDDLLNQYGILKCSILDFEKIDKAWIKGYRKNSFGIEALVIKNKIKGNYVIDHATIEDIMLYHIKESSK